MATSDPTSRTIGDRCNDLHGLVTALAVVDALREARLASFKVGQAKEDAEAAEGLQQTRLRTVEAIEERLREVRRQVEGAGQ